MTENAKKHVNKVYMFLHIGMALLILGFALVVVMTGVVK